MDIDVNDLREIVVPKENAICVISFSNLSPDDAFIHMVDDEPKGRKEIH